MAFTNVDTIGLKHAACRYDTNSCLFFVSKELLSAWIITAGDCTVGIMCVYFHMVGSGTQYFCWDEDGVASGTVHITVLFSGGTMRMFWFFRVTLTWYTVKLTVHPWSKGWLTERRVQDLSLGKICARCADFGKFGKESIAACVGLIWLPSGSVTDSGDLVSFWFVQILVACIKWPVMPPSAIALSYIWFGGDFRRGMDIIGR